MKKQLLLIAILGLFIGTLNAQLKIDAQLRTRGEASHGYKKIPAKETDAAFFVGQRTRLNLTYKKDWLETKISVQDVRVWGDDNNYSKAGMWGNTNSFHLFEGWAKLNANENFFVKVGRQQWKYDDQRLLCGRNWSNYGLTYDGLLASYKKDKIQIDAGFSLNNNAENIFGNDYRTLISSTIDTAGNVIEDYEANKLKTSNFLYLKYAVSKELYISVLSLWNGMQNPNTASTIYMTGTNGVNAFYKSKGLFGHATFYHQMGKNQSGTDVNAFMFSAQAGYKFFKKLSVSAGVDYFSGSDGSDPDVDNNFNLYYGARFKFNGQLNYFTLMGSHTKGGGLMNPFFKIAYGFNKKNKIMADYHMFMLANDVKKADGSTYDSNLGSEIDMAFLHKFNKQVNVKIGFNYAITSETLNTFKNVADAGIPYRGYVMLTVKPEFLNNIKKEPNN